MNNQQWDALRHSLRMCHDSIDSGLAELHALSRDAGDVENQLMSIDELKKSIQKDLRQGGLLIDDLANCSGRDHIKTAQLRRLEEVQSNYSQEFQQAFQVLEEKLQRRKLFQSSVVGKSDNETSAVSEQKLLLREKDSIHSSVSMLDSVLSQGRESMNSLARQKDRLVGVGGQVQQFVQRFPHVRNVMNRIHRAKLKQSIVLATTVALCILFLLWFSFG